MYPPGMTASTPLKTKVSGNIIDVLFEAFKISELGFHLDFIIIISSQVHQSPPKFKKLKNRHIL